MRNLAFGNWADRAPRASQWKNASIVHFPQTSFRQREGMPEGFLSLDDILNVPEVAADEKLLEAARKELADEKKISGLAGLRLKRGLSQAELAEKIGTSQPRLSMWEKRVEQPSLASLEKLRDVLDVSYDELVGSLLK